METAKTYDTFPIRIVIVSNLVALLIYISGCIIMLRLGLISGVLYLLFILAFEYRLLSRHCVNCYYWGKTCGFGKGVLSSLLFKKGDPSEFCSKTMSWKDLIPDLLIPLVPVLISIVLLIIRFDIILLTATILITGLTTIGNGFVRGSLTCKYCRQRESGCPAEKLFSKENSA